VNDRVIAGYQEYVPSLGDRLRRAFGYRRDSQRFDEEPPGCPHWAKTVVAVRFSLLDRLRLLATGAVNVELEHRTDVEVSKMVTKTSLTLIGPGDERLKL